MAQPVLIEVAKVMPKGQITLPKDIRQKLSLDTGDRVALIWDQDRVVMMNPAVYAMRMLQRDLEGAAAEAGFNTEEDVSDHITQMRRQARRV
ncbi:MAG: AbrB/MazE/SpoVT family DNA-binding domain-containing protein [Propionibacteriaceae bacterium]|jgi:AbrB family looped-hinge helix DNA binding protein|nr:AbrB/MazE/SpoVT family DNA-binding domain-containing protein [Propionibacteriaceae bacterium]